ncbi:MAG: bifunctional oligoribonuclease/PAP phosphatase NrnA [Bacteroidales bacterium]|nr:MAG: bifunctional oligoribonuclease/PAP phosphatase NrnA [Bacteroidales bacterium]
MKSISKKSIIEIKKHLSGNPNVLLLTHINPDGDAIGSLLGLYHFLKLRNFHVTAITPNDFPEFLRWLPGSREIICFVRKKKTVRVLIEKADIIFNLDFNDPDRLGEMGKMVEKAKAYRILIDHHPDAKHFADIEITDITVSSTAELLYQILNEIENKPFLTREIAECLYTGIMTDTGCFSFNSSGSATYRVIAGLLDAKIDKDRIFDLVYNNFSEDRMRLLGFALKEKMTVLPEYGTAYISLTLDEIKKFNFSIGDSEGFVNYPLSIKGIRFSALFLERRDHVKISFRSAGNFPVNRFAEEHFNGGGHLNAAGGDSFESLDKTIGKFNSLIKKYSRHLARS